MLLLRWYSSVSLSLFRYLSAFNFTRSQYLVFNLPHDTQRVYVVAPSPAHKNPLTIHRHHRRRIEYLCTKIAIGLYPVFVVFRQAVFWSVLSSPLPHTIICNLIYQGAGGICLCFMHMSKTQYTYSYMLEKYRFPLLLSLLFISATFRFHFHLSADLWVGERNSFRRSFQLLIVVSTCIFFSCA